MRVFYARMMTDHGLDVLAGQNWSLATLYKDNLNPRDEDVPLGIDAQYIVGFNWTRTPQLRLVEHFNKKISAGFSIESPQTVTGTGINSVGAPAGTYPPSDVVYQNNGNGAGLMNTTTPTAPMSPRTSSSRWRPTRAGVITSSTACRAGSARASPGRAARSAAAASAPA